jgi:hypothetical protein
MFGFLLNIVMRFTNLIERTKNLNKFTLLIEARAASEYYNDKFSNPIFDPFKNQITERINQILNNTSKNHQIEWILTWTKAMYYIRIKPSDEREAHYNKFFNKLAAKIKNTAADELKKYSSETYDAGITFISRAIHYLNLNLPEINNISWIDPFILPDALFQKFYEIEEEYKENAGGMLPLDDLDDIILTIKNDTSNKTWIWVKRKTNSLPRKECDVAGHCGTNTNADYFLRLSEYKFIDGNNFHMPKLWFAMSGKTLKESKGTANSKPAEKYHKFIVDLIIAGKLTKINQQGSYSPEDNFSLDDLDQKYITKLTELNKLPEEYDIEKEYKKAKERLEEWAKTESPRFASVEDYSDIDYMGDEPHLDYKVVIKLSPLPTWFDSSIKHIAIDYEDFELHDETDGEFSLISIQDTTDHYSSYDSGPVALVNNAIDIASRREEKLKNYPEEIIQAMIEKTKSPSKYIRKLDELISEEDIIIYWNNTFDGMYGSIDKIELPSLSEPQKNKFLDLIDKKLLGRERDRQYRLNIESTFQRDFKFANDFKFAIDEKNLLYVDIYVTRGLNFLYNYYRNKEYYKSIILDCLKYVMRKDD